MKKWTRKELEKMADAREFFEGKMTKEERETYIQDIRNTPKTIYKIKPHAYVYVTVKDVKGDI